MYLFYAIFYLKAPLNNQGREEGSYKPVLWVLKKGGLTPIFLHKMGDLSPKPLVTAWALVKENTYG